MSSLIVLHGVRTIQLNRVQNTLIDESDVGLIPKRRWISQCTQKTNSCAIIRGYVLHRLLMGLVPGDPLVVDHKNGDPMDNRRENLRICSSSQNAKNQRRLSRRYCKYKGVTFIRIGKYKSTITSNGKTFQLGIFKTEIEAAIAYDEAAINHHGEFACTNAMMGLYDE